MAAKIYLIRHGKRYPYRQDREKPVHLTPEGWMQAAQIAEWLRDKKINLILASPKLRAIQSALPSTLRLDAPLQVWPILIEYDSYGPLDYRTEYGYPIVGEPMSGSIRPDEETLEDAYRRALAALARLPATENVAIFSHDYFNSIFVWAHEGIPWQGAGRYHQDEACVNVLEKGQPPQINLKVC